MKFQDKLDIAIARGYVKKKKHIIELPQATQSCCLFPCFRTITQASLHRAMRRAGYIRAINGKNSWKRREDCVQILRCHQ